MISLFALQEVAQPPACVGPDEAIGSDMARPLGTMLDSTITQRWVHTRHFFNRANLRDRAMRLADQKCFLLPIPYADRAARLARKVSNTGEDNALNLVKVCRHLTLKWHTWIHPRYASANCSMKRAKAAADGSPHSSFAYHWENKERAIALSMPRLSLRPFCLF